MKGHVDFPEFCVLQVGNNSPLQFFVENTVIEIIIDPENIHESIVTGSKETDMLNEYIAKTAYFEEKVMELSNEFMMLRTSSEEDEEWENEYMAKMEELQQQLLEYVKQFAAENPNSIFMAILLNNLLSVLEDDELDLILNGYDELHSQSPWVQRIKEQVEGSRRLAIGQPFIDLRMPDPDGNEIALSDIAGKGKYVLIDFWAAWCEPCRVANPHLVELYDKYKDKDFEIVGVSFDMEKNDWVQAIKDDELTWTQMSDLAYWQSEGAKLYSVNLIPHMVLLDKEGKILARGIRMPELEELLTELLD